MTEDQQDGPTPKGIGEAASGVSQDKGGVQEPFIIFVNRRRFGVEDGVQEKMTGRQIAALVEVPAEVAVIRHDTGGLQTPIAVDEKVHVKRGDQFLVTRKTVEGGNATRTY